MVSFALLELARNPEAQYQLCAEIQVMFSDIATQVRFYDTDGITSQEVLRVFSTGPIKEHMAVRDVVIPLEESIITASGEQITAIPVSKGEFVIVAPASYHQLVSWWGSDAHELKPSQWLDGTASQTDALGPLTFLAGGRTCLGIPSSWCFAILEMQVLLFELVRRFSFALPPDSGSVAQPRVTGVLMGLYRISVKGPITLIEPPSRHTHLFWDTGKLSFSGESAALCAAEIPHLTLAGSLSHQAPPETDLYNGLCGETFFSVDNAAEWMTSRGYRLFQEHDATKPPDRSFHPDRVSLKDLRGYREQVIGPAYSKNPFFGIERTKEWVLPAPFATYMQAVIKETAEQDLRGRPRERSPEVFCSASHASSSSGHTARLLSGSRAQSPQVHSGTSSPVSSRATSRSREDSPLQSTSGAPKHSHIFAERLKGKEKARETDADSDGEDGKVKITRELHVNSLTRLTEAPSTWTVPQDNTAYFLDLSECPEVLDEPRKAGIPRRIDVYLRDEDQDVWGGSTGSKKGDMWVYALGGDRVPACRAHLRCQGVCTSMRDLWNHKLDANEYEAASVGSILSRFYQQGPNQYGTTYFVGCSKWHPSQHWSHIYHTIPPNVDEDTFKYVLEHAGRLPEDTPDINVMCALTLHPQLIIFVPVQPHADAMYVWRPELAFQAIVFLQTAHNHPAHPQAKPSTKDDRLLDAAMRAVGSKHLSVRKLLTAQSTLTLYDGRRVGEVSPAFINTRKICQCIAAYQKTKYPHGKGFQGVLHHIETHERPLPIKERYIHAAMTKGDFTLVVTLNPQLVYLIHSVLSVVIDYIFKHIEGDMDEWVVSGFSDRFKRSRNHFLLASIATKNQQPHFTSSSTSYSTLSTVHINELSKSNVPQDVLTHLKSILGLASQEEIDAWHAFCASQTDQKVQQWYLQKQRNPWYLPSVNQYLSRILLEDWKITPRKTNIAETSHAVTNADTQLPLLPAILVTQERDKDDVEEIHQIVRDGIMRKHWNGPSEREHLSEQRAGWSAHQREERNDDLVTYDTLAKDWEEGQEEWRFSLTHGHALQAQIQLIQAELKVDKRRTDLSEELKTLRAALEFEKQARRDWVTQRGETDSQMKVLGAGPLKGVQINRNQPVAALSDTAIPDDLNNGQAEFFDEDMGQLEYFPSDPLNYPLPSSVHHPGPLELHWNAAFELDPALEPIYHALGGSDYATADYNGSGSDYVLPLPPPSPPVQPPDTSAPSDTSGPSRTRRRKREQEVDPANEVEGKRSRTASRRARGK
ncbi:hypothetical protein DFH08DRAFT_820276 [Mycena albidolilacea]|uniref:Uncharacterized protein n=1 Tax=Mycena albidolilacea TaxID=1033008 RepID=A0AAD6ZCT8_9AGAR|nr:hypothetical protein DFH08DRAFT_820276 [Mycena albidolilacea]